MLLVYANSFSWIIKYEYDNGSGLLDKTKNPDSRVYM
jgi:hypothetical protein